MGQVVSCANGGVHHVSDAIKSGDIYLLRKIVEKDPTIINRPIFSYNRLTTLHIAAHHGRTHVMGVLLDLGADPDVRCAKSTTPLMVACKRGKVACVDRLLQSGANVLAFEARNGRTCLHYAARGGHFECVERIIRAAQAGPVASSWGFVRFVNMRDAIGATPLHMAARAGNAPICLLLLENRALVSATTSTFGYGPHHGSTPLHSAARGGSVEVIHELLAWGAERAQRDLMGSTPYQVALKNNNNACAKILNPDAAEPIVWPSAWKFINNLEPKAKSILQAALVAANQAREKDTSVAAVNKESTMSDSQLVPGKLQNECLEETKETGVGMMGLCSICFEELCTFEVKDCGHQMCASCTLALCCHNKPNPSNPCSGPPACPFCRGNIGHLVLVQLENKEIKHHELELAKSGSMKINSKSWSRGSISSGGGSRGSGQMSAKGSGRIRDADWISHL